MNRLLRRFSVLFFSLTTILVVLEISLRLVGGEYARMSDSGNLDRSACGTTILTVGDSVTFGIGAPNGFSYPAQLEKMLNQSNDGTCFSVINRGRPGQNSSQILTMLEDWLRQFHPDIVTILIGAQNQVNYFGFQAYLDSKEMQPSRWIKLHEYFDHLKVYKFIRYLLIDLKRKEVAERRLGASLNENESMENLAGSDEGNLQTGLYDDAGAEDERRDCSVGAELRENGEWEKSHQLLMEKATEGPLSAVCYNMIGSDFRERNLPFQAIPWFKKGIEADPAFYDNYEEIGGIYYEQGQVDEALQWFLGGMAKADPALLHDQSYINIGRAFSDTGKTSEAVGFFEQEKEKLSAIDSTLEQIVDDYLLIFSETASKEAIKEWIASDLEKMVDLCEKYNARVVLQNYPYEPEVNHLYRMVAEKRGVLFVDQERIFSRFVSNGVRDPEVFVPDGHPNTKGYSMMAENLYHLFEN